MFLEPRQGEQALSDTESLEEWKSFSAFVSRLVNSGFTELIYLALWELSGALESVPTEQKALMDCQVWAATEWILQCAQLLMKEMMAVGAGDGETDATDYLNGTKYSAVQSL